jgi:hypothetical protein
MSYSKYTYEKVENELGITYKSAHFFPEKKQLFPNDWLLTTLEMGKPFATLSEKSRSENIVHPILIFLCNFNAYKYSVYSGMDLNVEAERDLNGECDFILGKGEPNPRLNVPLFCLIEAKDQDIKRAIPQCTAQMYAARLQNERKGNGVHVIYGCVTTGIEWHFLKLENDICWVDVDKYYSLQLPDLLGALQQIVSFYVE